MIEFGLRFRWSLSALDPAGSSIATGSNFVMMAERAHKEGMANRLVFYLVSNEYLDFERRDPATGERLNSPDWLLRNRALRGPLGQNDLCQREALARLIRHVSPGTNAYVIHGTTAWGSKSGSMGGVMAIAKELPDVDTYHIIDNYANIQDVDGWMEDLHRIRANPHLAVINGMRETSVTSTDVGDAGRIVELGHGTAMQGAQDLIGTGWASFVRIPYWDTVRAMAWTDCPTLPLLDSEQSRTGLFRRMFGLHGFGLWGYGISEDHWGVIEQTHNLLGLGYSPAFALSRHRYIRARERLPTEWEGAPYRWSSGLKQTEMDPLEQLAMEFGPLSYFERELRQFAGDFYTVAPFAVLTLLLFPWSIGYGFSAFVGISLVFLFAGDTLNALIFAWHDSGWTGVLRWLRTRPRDIRLFAPRLVLEAMGQVAVYLDPILKGFGEILGEDGGRRLNRVFPRVSNEFALSGVGNWRVRGLRGAFKGSPYWPLWNPGRRPSLFQSYLTVMLLGLVLTLAQLSQLTPIIAVFSGHGPL